jgi:hypothetical protein
MKAAAAITAKTIMSARGCKLHSHWNGRKKYSRRTM